MASGAWQGQGHILDEGVAGLGHPTQAWPLQAQNWEARDGRERDKSCLYLMRRGLRNGSTGPRMRTSVTVTKPPEAAGAAQLPRGPGHCGAGVGSSRPVSHLQTQLCGLRVAWLRWHQAGCKWPRTVPECSTGCLPSASVGVTGADQGLGWKGLHLGQQRRAGTPQAEAHSSFTSVPSVCN